MKVKGLNKSSLKTKNMIRNEFAKMIKEKGEIRNISVTELVKNIDINRGTFYSHYNSLDDVAKEFQNEALDLFNEDISSLYDVNSFIDKINHFLKSNANLYSAILKADDPMMFMSRLKKIAYLKLIEISNNKCYYNKNFELNVSVFVDGIIGLYIKYFRDEINYSLDDINDYSKWLFKTMFTN